MTQPLIKPFRAFRPGLLIGLISYLVVGVAIAQPADQASAQLSESRPAQIILGWIEPVQVNWLPHPIEAKIDSGADHSSLHATEIQFHDKGQTTWVRFRSVDHQILDYPLLRSATIKRKDATVEKRPVVKMQICIDHQWQTVAVNLVNRSHFRYPMLIGRSALTDGFLIDPNRTHLTQPQCAPQQP